MGRYTRNTPDAVWHRVHVQPEGCWEWQGAGSPYGRMRVDGRTEGAHRAAYLSAHGPIPEGLCVLHTCDNPPCCRPSHLFLGTAAANAVDREAKGRGDQQRGERSGQSKLTDEGVKLIRVSVETDRALAKRFGVSQKAISDVRLGKTWKHIALTYTQSKEEHHATTGSR